MEFLLDPLEIGSDLDDLMGDELLGVVTCKTGYICKTGEGVSESDEN